MPDTLTPKSPAIARHLVPTAELIRCPVCGSARVVYGNLTDGGRPIFCMDEEKMYPTRSES